MKINTSRKSGFTLVEIMIVVAIIGLLAAIAIPNFVKARTTAQTNACVSNMKQLDGAKDMAALESGLSTGGNVDDSVKEYIKGGVPNCPVGNAKYAVNPVGTDPACTSTEATAHNNKFAGL